MVAILCVMFILTVIFFMLSVEFYEAGQEYVIVFTILIFTLIVASFYIMSEDKKLAYKQGQIDAINGKIKYELVKQPDGTTEWEEKKEG